MSVTLNMFGSMEMYSQFPDEPEKSPLSERLSVVGLVVLLHLTALAAYLMQPETPAVVVNEMSISFANVEMQRAEVVPPKPEPKLEPKPEPKPKPREIEPEPIPVDEPVVKEEAPPAPQEASPPSPPAQVAQEVAPPAPVLPDTEPDYRADYLNNPRPSYPMVARRMGFQGKVILNVEVLAEGKAGQVLLHQSCGHQVLDNAALQTVKTWRFSPARRLGQPVTQWFLVPIKFSLEGNEA